MLAKVKFFNVHIGLELLFRNSSRIAQFLSLQHSSFRRNLRFNFIEHNDILTRQIESSFWSYFALVHVKFRVSVSFLFDLNGLKLLVSVCVKRRTEHAFELRLLVGIHDVIHSAAGGEGVVLKAEELFGEDLIGVKIGRH